jgi:hypothetical protein
VLCRLIERLQEGLSPEKPSLAFDHDTPHDGFRRAPIHFFTGSAPKFHGPAAVPKIINRLLKVGNF